MILEAAFASDDYRAGSFVEIRLSSMGGNYSIKRILARVNGNAAGDCEVSIYVAEKGKASLTNQERAESEVYFNDAVVAAADPAPDLNATGTGIPFYIGSTDSIYVHYKDPDNPTTCDVSLYI